MRREHARAWGREERLATGSAMEDGTRRGSVCGHVEVGDHVIFATADRDSWRVVLDGVTVEFEEGAFSAIMGPSGSGKSTLLHCIAGLDTLTSGAAYIGGTDLGSLKDKDLTILRREQVGFIFQAFNLVPTLNAQENILLPMTIAGTKPDQEWFDQVVTTVGLAENYRTDVIETRDGRLAAECHGAGHHRRRPR